MPDNGSKSLNLWNIVFHWSYWLLFAEKETHSPNVLIGEKTMDGRYSVDIEAVTRPPATYSWWEQLWWQLIMKINNYRYKLISNIDIITTTQITNTNQWIHITILTSMITIATLVVGLSPWHGGGDRCHPALQAPRPHDTILGALDIINSLTSHWCFTLVLVSLILFYFLFYFFNVCDRWFA